MRREPPDFDAFEEEAATVERPRRDYTTDEVVPLAYAERAAARQPVGVAVVLSRILAVLTLLVVVFGMALIAGW